MTCLGDGQGCCPTFYPTFFLLSLATLNEEGHGRVIIFTLQTTSWIVVQDNPSDKDVNQGTLVVFNLDASVTNDDLRQIFGVYGEVKEVS